MALLQYTLYYTSLIVTPARARNELRKMLTSFPSKVCAQGLRKLEPGLFQSVFPSFPCPLSSFMAQLPVILDSKMNFVAFS